MVVLDIRMLPAVIAVEVRSNLSNLIVTADYRERPGPAQIHGQEGASNNRLAGMISGGRVTTVLER